MRIHPVVRVFQEDLLPIGPNALNIQVQPFCKVALIVQRFREQHFGIQKQNRRCPVDDRNHV